MGINNAISAFSITSNYDSIREEKVFSDLLKVLMAYAHKLIGDQTYRLSKNKSDLAYDLAMESIKRYLEEPSKFCPSRNPDLVKYLKYNILRRLVSNYKDLKGQRNEVLYEQDDTNGIFVMNYSIPELDYHDAIDLRNIVNTIEDEVKSNTTLKQLFELRYLKDYSRAEIIRDLMISEGEYNNRIRRLDTVRKRILKMQKVEIGI